MSARVDSARRLAERAAARAQERPTVRMLIGSFEREQRSGAGLLASGLAYRMFLWLVPFGLVIAAIASFWVRLDPSSLEQTAKDFGLGGVAAHSATTAVYDGSQARWYLLAAGLVFCLWAGVKGVQALRVSAMIAWGLAPTRMRRPLHASAAFAGLAIAGLGASIFASWGRHHFGGFGLLVTTADVIVYTLIALIAFTHLPRPEQVGRHELWPGALLVGWGLTAVHLFLAYYLAGRLESSPGFYGALGASTVVLLVLFLIARLVLSAMFLNATLYRTGQADGA